MLYNRDLERADLGVEWLLLDTAKESYIQTAHRVSGTDVFEVFANAPHFYRNTSGKGAPGVMLGPNRAGRFLTVAIAPVDSAGAWRVVTAYWLRESRGRRRYGG
jgi:hypothetical protein